MTQFCCVCCPLLASCVHCNLSSARNGLSAPFSLLLIPPPTASPSMRGSTPLDVAASSVMDNNELALGLEEPDLEKVNGPGEALCLFFAAYSATQPSK